MTTAAKWLWAYIIEVCPYMMLALGISLTTDMSAWLICVLLLSFAFLEGLCSSVARDIRR